MVLTTNTKGPSVLLGVNRVRDNRWQQICFVCRTHTTKNSIWLHGHKTFEYAVNMKIWIHWSKSNFWIYFYIVLNKNWKMVRTQFYWSWWARGPVCVLYLYSKIVLSECCIYWIWFSDWMFFDCEYKTGTQNYYDNKPRLNVKGYQCNQSMIMKRKFQQWW